MRGIVRTVFSSDVDVASYVSNDPERDGVWVRLVVGPSNAPGEESFDVLVCTPLWLREVIAESGPQVGLHHLIIDPLNLSAAIEFLRHRVEATEAPDWPTLASKLARLGYWEFDDYQPQAGDERI